MEWFLGFLLVAAVIVGALSLPITKKVDSAPEQVSEAVLRSQGIEVDFSANEKSRTPTQEIDLTHAVD